MPLPRPVSSAGGVRSLMRICVASAQETLKILDVLQAQSLLGACDCMLASYLEPNHFTNSTLQRVSYLLISNQHGPV